MGKCNRAGKTWPEPTMLLKSSIMLFLYAPKNRPLCSHYAPIIPQVGLASEALLAEEPALRRVVELVRGQIARLRRGISRRWHGLAGRAGGSGCDHDGGGG